MQLFICANLLSFNEHSNKLYYGDITEDDICNACSIAAGIGLLCFCDSSLGRFANFYNPL